MRKRAVWHFAAIVAALVFASARAVHAEGPPTVGAQPSSLSVASGASASFSITATGLAPLRYQWLFNGTNVAGATNATLEIASVQPRHWGLYSAIVTNALGSVTSQVAQLTVDADLVFRLLTVQTNAAVVVDHNALTGDDRGGIAVSATSVFVTGDGTTASNFDPVTARFPIDTLSGGSSIGRGFDALTSNLRTETVYSLGNGAVPIQYIDSSLNPTTANSLIELDPTTGQPTGQILNLSSGIPLSGNSSSCGVFAGYDRVVIYNGSNQRAYNIALPSGTVTDLGSVGSISRQSSESWAFWGIAEYFAGAIHLVLVQNATVDGVSGSTVARVRLPDRATTYLLGPFGSGSPGLADMASITFSTSRSRWFFRHENTSVFRTSGEVVGSAKGSFTTDASYPTFLVEPVGLVSYPSSNVTFQAVVSGEAPFRYQWLFNGKAIEGATNLVLNLTAIDTNAMGYYAIEASNPAGSLVSRQALLTIYSIPQITLQPQSRSVFPGTNTIFSLAANAAPPVFYQWRFNGIAIAGATNSFLQLTNIQPSQDGFYSAVISNRFGTATSSAAELNVVVPLDDGAVFQITGLSTNGARIAEVYETLDFNYGYGPLAVSSARVFYSGFSDAAHNSAVDLSGGTALARVFTAICSDLRTETVYALGNNTGPFTNYNPGTLTSLWEVNGNNGTLTGNRIILSSSIAMPSQSSQVGFFAGYERMILLAGGRAYSLSIPAGIVSDLGPMSVPSHAFSIGSAGFWGVAEHAHGIDYIAYARTDGQSIARTRVPDGVTTNLASIPGLSSYTSMTVSVPRGRWYFHYVFGSGAFGGANSTIGYATASFTNNSGFRPAKLEWSSIADVQALNGSIPVTLTARTAGNLVVTNYSRPVTLSGQSGATAVTITPTGASNFVNGIWTGQITVSQLSTGMVLRAVDSLGVSGTSTVFSVNGPNDLVLSVKDSPDPVFTGQRLTYTLTAFNLGPNSASSVVLTNLLSPRVSFISAASSHGTCTLVDRTVHCPVGTITPGNPAVISIEVEAGLPGSVTNQAGVVRGETDPVPANNSLVTLTTIIPPTLTIDDATMVEGNSGTNDLGFVLRVFPPTTNVVTVNFSTFNNTAIGSGTAPDYVPTNGTIIFPPGVTNQVLTIKTRGDIFYEFDETFFISLSGAVNATLADNQGVGTLLNDDEAPTIAVSDVSVIEGDAGVTNAIFQIRLSTNSGVAVSIAFTTVDGTARAGSDFTGTNGLITIPAGALALTRNVPVAVAGDTLVENNETFRLVLSVTNAIAVNTQAVCTILADDGLGTVQTFAWSEIPSAQERGTPFPVTITALDAIGAPATNFLGTVTFTGRSGPGPASIFGDAEFSNTGTGDYTIGYTFVPKADLTVTHLRHYYGTRVSLWTEAGLPLASLPVTSTNGIWQEAALPAPVQLTAGSNYLIAAYSGGSSGSYFLRNDPTTNFTHVTLGIGRFTTGDALPNQDAGVPGWAVDFRYSLTGQDQTVAIQPTQSGAFLNGIWTGNLSVLTATTNVTINATDANQHSGFSAPFDVVPTLGADVAVSVTATSAVPIGSNLTYVITVTNRGPRAATGLLMTDSVPSSFTVLSVASTVGQATNIGPLVAASIGTLPNRGSAIITLAVRVNALGIFTNTAIASLETFDPVLANNQASAPTQVYRDTDGDGLWDSWEIAYGLSIHDPGDAALDPDGDRHTNWQEFIAGTQPNNSNSITRIVGVTFDSGTPQLSFRGARGKSYQLDRREGSATNWTAVAVYQIGTETNASEVIQMTDTLPASAPVRLYRVRVLP